MLPYAFVRIVLLFIGGILTGIYFPDLISGPLAVTLLFTGCTVYAILFIIQRCYSPLVKPGWIAPIIFFLSGYICLLLKTETNREDHLIYQSDYIHYYQVTISTYPEEKENSWKQVGEVQYVKTKEGIVPVSGKVLLYFNKNLFKDPFKYGDILLIKGNPKLIAEPANPHEFDYRKFLSYRNIFHQDFINKAESICYIANDPPSKVLDLAMTFRSKMLDILSENVQGEKELAITSALVLGVKDGLDDELLKAYAASGAMHVLAVSGLHIGIVYWFVLLLLKPFARTLSGRWMVAGLSVLFLWTYAFVTGLSPSVLRAATMFSFVALATPASQRTNIYNILALSAFCLLLIDPYLIMAVGFQLSFMAVLGIVYFFPRFNAILSPSSWLLSQIWKLTSVSLAAQIATFALGLLYFHQFPVYFMFSNLFVIPLAFSVLASGLLLLVFSFITPVVQVLGYITTVLVKLLNITVTTTENLPFSIIDGVYLTIGQCWILIAWVTSLVILLERKKFQYLYVCVALVGLLSWMRWSESWSKRDENTLIVYRVTGHTAIDLIEENHAYFLTDSTDRQQEDLFTFHIRGNRIKQGINHIENLSTQSFVRDFKGCRLVLWKGLKILIINKPEFNFLTNWTIDYLIVCKDAIHDLESLKSVNYKQLIADSSNSWSCANRLVRQANSMEQEFHSVLHSGAFILSH